MRRRPMSAAEALKQSAEHQRISANEMIAALRHARLISGNHLVPQSPASPASRLDENERRRLAATGGIARLLMSRLAPAGGSEMGNKPERCAQWQLMSATAIIHS